MWEILKMPLLFGLGWGLGWVIFYALIAQLFVYLPKALYWANKGAVRYTSALYYLATGGFFLALSVSVFTVYPSTLDFILDNWMIAIGWFFGASKAWSTDFDYHFWRSNINANFLISESPIAAEKLNYFLSRSATEEAAQNIVHAQTHPYDISGLIRNDIRFILLAGVTGSGKNTYAFFLHSRLAEDNPKAKFLILDMSRCNYTHYAKSKRLYKPLIYDPKEGLEALEKVAKTYGTDEPKLVVHIQECDMAYYDKTRFESAIEEIRRKENVLIVYSTSRIDQEYLQKWLDEYVDLRFIFRTKTQLDSRFLLGNKAAVEITRVGEAVARVRGEHQDTIIEPLSVEMVDKMRHYNLD